VLLISNVNQGFGTRSYLTDLSFVKQLREIELKVQREITEKRQELLAKEEALRSLEARLAQAQESNTS
jgi:hypothetical protein